MNYQSELNDTAQSVASNPKMLAAVAGANTALGAASIADVISGALSCGAILIGIIVTVMLGRVHWISFKNLVLENKLLMRQLRDIGIDPDKDE